MLPAHKTEFISRVAAKRFLHCGIKHIVLLLALLAWITAALLGGTGCSGDDCLCVNQGKDPRIISIFPAANDSGVAVDTFLTVVFDADMDPATISSGSFTLDGPEGRVDAVVWCGARTATLTPLVQLAGHSTYTARIDAGVSDMAGNHMSAPYAWTFYTDVANLLLSADIEYTIRDSDGDNLPDSLIGGGPPGRILQTGETGAQEDRAISQFPLGAIMHDEILQAFGFITLAELVPSPATVHVEVWGFAGGGGADLSDWGSGSLLCSYDDIELSAGTTFAYPLTDMINAALDAEATHVGVRIVITGQAQAAIATSDHSQPGMRQRILLIY